METEKAGTESGPESMDGVPGDIDACQKQRNIDTRAAMIFRVGRETWFLGTGRLLDDLGWVGIASAHTTQSVLDLDMTIFTVAHHQFLHPQQGAEGNQACQEQREALFHRVKSHGKVQLLEQKSVGYVKSIPVRR